MLLLLGKTEKRTKIGEIEFLAENRIRELGLAPKITSSVKKMESALVS